MSIFRRLQSPEYPYFIFDPDNFSHFNNIRNTGTFMLNTKYTPRKRWKYGVDLVYERHIKGIYDKSNQFMDDEFIHFMSFIPRVDYYWVYKPKFRAYSGIGAGVTFQLMTYRLAKYYESYFMMNIVPLGFEVGNRISFYGEANYFANGIVSGGLRVKL
jgi:hypothetical protein